MTKKEKDIVNRLQTCLRKVSLLSVHQPEEAALAAKLATSAAQELCHAVTHLWFGELKEAGERIANAERIALGEKTAATN